MRCGCQKPASALAPHGIPKHAVYHIDGSGIGTTANLPYAHQIHIGQALLNPTCYFASQIPPWFRSVDIQSRFRELDKKHIHVHVHMFTTFEFDLVYAKARLSKTKLCNVHRTSTPAIDGEVFLTDHCLMA